MPRWHLGRVETSDFMTAEAVHLPWEVLDAVTSRIVNEVKGLTGCCMTARGSRRGRLSSNSKQKAGKPHKQWAFRLFIPF